MRLPMKWIGRLVGGVVLLNGLIQFQILQFIPGLGGEPRCYKYDLEARPGMFRVQGRSFNVTNPSLISTFHGKGIVMSASGNHTREAIGAYISAYIFRKVLKTDLPIEIFYPHQDEAFHGPIQEALASLPNVELRNLHESLQQTLHHHHPPPLHILAHPQSAKVYAMQASSFRETLLMEAGVVPFVDPEFYFNLPSYKDHGMAIFSDFTPIDKTEWRAMLRRGLCIDYKTVKNGLGGREADASCVVFDKGLNADALDVVVALNGPMQGITYQTLAGDKNTWALAMMHVGKTVSVKGLEPGYLLVSREKGKARKITGHLHFLHDPSSSSSSITTTANGEEHSGLIPLHYRNQMLDSREYPFIINQIYTQILSNLGGIRIPENDWRDCRHYAIKDLYHLHPIIHEAFMAVAQALKDTTGMDHCLCQEDILSCEAEVMRLRKERWVMRLIDALGPRKKVATTQ